MLRRVFGHSAQERLRQGRLRCAKWYLRHTNLSMNRIAYLCGFGTRGTFFKEFRERSGLTPGDYRRRSK